MVGKNFTSHPTHAIRLTVIGSVFVASALCSGEAHAKPTGTTYDIASYKAPSGYKVDETTPLMLKMSKVAGPSYCAVTLLAALPSAGTVQQDFDAEWKLLGSQVSLGTATSKPAAGRTGWQAVAGSGSFTMGDYAGRAVLTTFSSGGQRFSLLLLTNQLELCAADYGNLVKSLALPDANASTPAPTTGTSAPAATTPAPAATTSRYRYNTTLFQDGWTSTQQPDWVQATNGTVTVRLHYPIAFTDETRTMDPSARVRFFWNQIVAPRYQTGSLAVAPTEAGVGMSSFGDAEVTAVGSTATAHVGLLLTSENGSVYPIEIVAPDAAAFRAQFPTYEKMKSMSGLNKFQVDEADLRGTWENSSSAYGMYYSSGDGSFAGMRGASVYDKFVFSANSRYVWEALGVSTGRGTGTVSQGTVKGTFKLNAWEATATDAGGKTTQYLVQFEAMRGGRTLILQNKQASGLRYVLVKTK